MSEDAAAAGKRSPHRAHGKTFCNPTAARPVSGPRKHIDPSMFEQTTVKRVPPELVRKYKAVLIGHEEVGKTSIRKCWDGDPKFFKKLPEVLSTTGIETRVYNLKFSGHGAGGKDDDNFEIGVQDFAGQEVYHSHSRFLTPRSVFLFVWKMTGQEDDQEQGMNQFEEERMMMWLDDVCSKAPGSSCILLGTHYDELRDQRQDVVEKTLKIVKDKFHTYAESLRMPDMEGNMVDVQGSYAVSCKSREAYGEGLKKAKMSELLRAVGDVAFNRCLDDRQFPQGAIPGRHLQLLRYLDSLRAERRVLLMPLQEYAEAGARFGIETTQELADCTMLYHCWSCLYVFRTARHFTAEHLEMNHKGVFLHPLWLARMIPQVFSMAHVVYTQPEMRRYIGGLEYPAEEALRADCCGLRRGELSVGLAEVIFSPALREIRGVAQGHHVDPDDVQLCRDLLTMMDLAYEEVIQGETRTFVPSLFPLRCPELLQDLAPYLFQNGLLRTYTFNIIPRDFYNRLVCRLQEWVVVLRVNVTGIVEPEGQSWGTDVQYLPEEERDCFELRSHWKDAVWLGGRSVRALLFHSPKQGEESAMLQAYISPGLDPAAEERVAQMTPGNLIEDPRTSSEMLHVINQVVSDLATEYDGLHQDTQEEDEPGAVALDPDTWDLAWDGIRNALGAEKGVGLLRHLATPTPDDAELPDPEVPVDGAQAARWLDRTVRQIMLIENEAEPHDGDGEFQDWVKDEKRAAERWRKAQAKRTATSAS